MVKLTYQNIRSKLKIRSDPTKLTTLDASSKQITEVGTFSKLVALEHVDLSNNRIRLMKHIKGLFDAPNLKSLNLTGNQVCRSTTYRHKIILIYPSLEVLDDVEITEEQRTAAADWRKDQLAPKPDAAQIRREKIEKEKARVAQEKEARLKRIEEHKEKQEKEKLEQEKARKQAIAEAREKKAAEKKKQQEEKKKIQEEKKKKREEDRKKRLEEKKAEAEAQKKQKEAQAEKEKPAEPVKEEPVKEEPAPETKEPETEGDKKEEEDMTFEDVPQREYDIAPTLETKSETTLFGEQKFTDIEPVKDTIDRSLFNLGDDETQELFKPKPKKEQKPERQPRTPPKKKKSLFSDANDTKTKDTSSSLFGDLDDDSDDDLFSILGKKKSGGADKKDDKDFSKFDVNSFVNSFGDNSEADDLFG